MYTIREIPYEESRRRFFEKLIRHQEEKIRYWQSPTKEPERAQDEISEAGAIISYCRDAIEAIEKQTQRKLTPTRCRKKCAACGHIITDKECIKTGLKYCYNCGQAIDWREQQ